jgi:type II secretory ATPase GspE/PulE/Tfp pilus assembly ATPase PilB-like protein
MSRPCLEGVEPAGAVPKTVGRGLTARVVGGMNIAERRVPQDGRVRLTVDGIRVDARLRTRATI